MQPCLRIRETDAVRAVSKHTESQFAEKPEDFPCFGAKLWKPEGDGTETRDFALDVPAHPGGQGAGL